MKVKQFHQLLGLLPCLVAAALFAPGCATQKEHSFNDDYGQHLAGAPMYAIEDMNDTQFKLTVRQGETTTSGPQRVVNMKQSASSVAETEAKRRGWQNWDLNYIQERDQGWMHILVGVVTRKNPVELTPGAQGGKP